MLRASPSRLRPTASRSASTYGLRRLTIAGTRVKQRTISRSGTPRIWARISPVSWLGRYRMSMSIEHRSGTLLKASPPRIRARLMLGRSKRSLDSRANGSVSMRRKASWALRIALSPSHGVEPCAAVPEMLTRIASTPLAWTPMCRSVGSPVIAKSDSLRTSAMSASIERSSMSSDSSSGTQTKITRTSSCSIASRVASIIAASAPFMS